MKTTQTEQPPTIKLSAALREQIKTCRDGVAAALDKYNRTCGNSETMAADEARLNTEVERLETEADYNDAAALGSLESKRAQLAQVRRRLASVEELHQPLLQSLRDAVSDVQHLTAKALSPFAEAEKDRIASIIRPYFQDEHRAKVAAANTGYISSLRSFLGRNYGSFPAADAKRAVSVLDAVLRGEVPWKFEPEAEGDQ